MTEIVNGISTIFGASWAAGVRLYMTIAALGLAQRFGWMDLPGNLDRLGHPLVILIAGVLTVVEFLGDKIPIADSVMDAVNTFVKPAGGAAIAWLAVGDTAPLIQWASAGLGGGISLVTHAVKATTRAAVNTSPEPVSNVVTSAAEDGLAAGGLWLLIANPIVMAVLVVGFLIFAVWFLRKMGKVFSRIFRFFFRSPEAVV